jgi:hypothetical protein
MHHTAHTLITAVNATVSVLLFSVTLSEQAVTAPCDEFARARNRRQRPDVVDGQTVTLPRHLES